MTASHGVWQYEDLIQTYNLNDLNVYPQKEFIPPSNTIMDFLMNPNFSFFRHLVITSKMDIQMSQEQFSSTVFVCDDNTLRKRYGEDFFMNLDRNNALNILNFHILPRVIGYKSLLQNKISKLDTKNPRSEIVFINKNGTIKLNGNVLLLEEIKKTNGIVYIIDDLLLPENFVLG